MASVTQTRNMYHASGHKTAVTATFTNPVDTNTWDTGLRTIDHITVTVVEATDAADAINPASISGGVVTLGVAGTVTSAMARAEGV